MLDVITVTPAPEALQAESIPSLTDATKMLLIKILKGSLASSYPRNFLTQKYISVLYPDTPQIDALAAVKLLDRGDV